MIRRLLLLSILGTAAFLAIAGWFGYRAYVNATNEWTYRQQFAAVAQAWPQPLPDRPVEHGSYPIQRLRTVDPSSGEFEVVVAQSACDSEPDPVASVDATQQYVAVLVHRPAQWLPDVGRLWGEITRAVTGSGCPAAARLTRLRVAVGEAISERPIVDARTGRPIPARP